MKSLLQILLVAVLLTSCAQEQPKNTTAEPAAEKKESTDCTYALLPGAKTAVTWTAYKFTEKLGVNGTFDKVKVGGNKNMSKNVVDVLNGAQIIIITESLNSKNPERDAKVVKSFFGVMTDTKSISGTIGNAKGTNRVGKCEANMKLNGVEKPVFLNYTIEGDKITLTGSMDLTDWNASNAVKSINEVCDELHKGEDGKSKLWSDIDLNIVSQLKVVCP